LDKKFLTYISNSIWPFHEKLIFCVMYKKTKFGVQKKLFKWYLFFFFYTSHKKYQVFTKLGVRIFNVLVRNFCSVFDISKYNFSVAGAYAPMYRSEFSDLTLENFVTYDTWWKNKIRYIIWQFIKLIHLVKKKSSS
jgi:hypothetical protein